jgi:hypothetical protein
MRSRILSALLALGLCALLGACFSSTEDDTAPTDDTAPDTTAGNELIDTHDGWRDPACWDCHDTASTHNSDNDPYECVTCHGTNGAPGGHTTHTPCAECHQQPHAADGFPDPDSCQVCHP